MSNSKDPEAIVALADTAMVASKGSGAEAAVMLMDAAIAIALTRLGSSANEMAGFLAEYIVQQIAHVTGEVHHA